MQIHRILMFSFFCGLFIAIPAISFALQTENNRTSSDAPATRIATRQLDLDLSETVRFTLQRVGDEHQVRYLGKYLGGQLAILNPTPDQIDELLKKEFANRRDLKGVVIEAERDVKNSAATKLFQTLQASMVKQNIERPIFVKVPTINQDEIITQEIVLKNIKAKDIYDKVSNVAKVLKYEVRLDLKRNSLTAKANARQILGFTNFVKALDVAPGGERTIPRIPSRNTPERPNTKSGNSNLVPAKDPPKIEPKPANPKVDLPPKTSVQEPSTGNSVAKPAVDSVPLKSGSVGRFQISAVGNTMVMLDTATGKSWFLDGDQQRAMYWTPIPLPSGLGQ